MSGTILISVNLSEVPDVYGPTPKNTAVTFPAASIYTAVSQASGLGLSSIQLLELPAANEGTIYVGSGTSQRADTSTLYGYSSGSQRISQLRFVPATGFTGSVEIPYVACNSSGTPIASGKLCLGVVEEMGDFSDISSSTWCYKYVLELSDADVIDGYSDGTFKPDNQVTYGAALKLIMLAAGYTEQAPVNSNVFSGYLARAQGGRPGLRQRGPGCAHHPAGGEPDRRQGHGAEHQQPVQRPALYRHQRPLCPGPECRGHRGGLLRQRHQHLQALQHPDPGPDLRHRLADGAVPVNRKKQRPPRRPAVFLQGEKSIISAARCIRPGEW